MSEEKPTKIRFASRYRKRLVTFAELPTAVKKVEYLQSHENFEKDFKGIYPTYYNYLLVSIDREKILKSMNEQILEMRKLIQEAQVDKEFQNHYKRLFRIHRKLTRKMRYRLHPNYFDNYLVNDWIAAYNSTNEEVYIDMIAYQIDLIIIRQVKRLKLYQFATAMDDLLQEIRLACLGALKKFDLSKGKAGREAFNYFSLICKRAGFMITLRHSDRKKRETPDSDVVAETLGDVAYDKDYIPTESNNDGLSAFYAYYHQLFERKERMQLLLQIMIYYILNVNFYTFKKNDFVKFACSYGFTPAFVNKFLNIIKASKEKFEKDVEMW